MRLLAVGVDHTRAPAAIREALAFSGEQMQHALLELRCAYPHSEFVILSTCNRVEVYAATDLERLPRDHAGLDAPELCRYLAKYHGVEAGDLSRHSTVYQDDGVVGHLFRVASSVESVVLGEGQILGQVRDAYQSAVAAHSVGWMTHSLFQHALRVGKKVRESTGLGVGKLSVASVAVELAREVFDQFNDKTVLVIGAGKMAELTLTHLIGLKPGRVIVVNRSIERGRELAGQFGGVALPMEQLNQSLIEADLVVSTTASAQPIMSLETYSRIQRSRKYRLALILDIAMPRDFDDRIGQLEQVMLYNVDDLKDQVERNLAQRRGGLGAANRLIEMEIAACLSALRHRKHAANVLKELGEHADRIREQELSDLFERLSDMKPEHRQAIERMAFRLQNQLLHEPRAALRANASASEDKSFSLPAAVGHIFGLNHGLSFRRRKHSARNQSHRGGNDGRDNGDGQG